MKTYLLYIDECAGFCKNSFYYFNSLTKQNSSLYSTFALNIKFHMISSELTYNIKNAIY